MGIGTRLQHAWNAFRNNRDPTSYYRDLGNSYPYRHARPRLSRGNERSIVTAVYNQIAIDASAIKIKHCRLNDDERYQETINSKLNYCLNTEANIDQTSRAFIHDAVLSMLESVRLRSGILKTLKLTFITN